MSKKTKKKWGVLSLKLRLFFVMIVIGGMLVVPIVALANSLNAPTASEWIPTREGVTPVSNPEVSLYVADTTDDINPTSLTAKINDKVVQATFSPKGHLEYDSCGGSYWVIESKKEGTISFKASGLPDGTNTVQISISDVAGNVLNETWSFTVAESPKVRNITPPDKSEHVSVNGVSGVVSDNQSVNWNSVKFNIRGVWVKPTNIDQTTGQVTYDYNFPQGTNAVSLEAADQAGHATTAQWSFSVGGAPTVIKWTPAQNSTTDVSNPKIMLDIKDANNTLDENSVSALIDGKPVQADFKYKGHLDYDSCIGEIWVIDSYKEGTVSINTTGLTDGPHEVEIRIADVIGNVLSERWTFNVAEAPKIGTVTPIDKSENASVSNISAKIVDNSSVDWESVRFVINGTTVTPSIDPSTNTANHNYDFATGIHTVKVEAKDKTGTPSSKTWSFLVDKEAPTVSSITNFSDSMTITDGKLNIALVLKDLVDLKDNETLSLDGEAINSTFQYKGQWDSCGNYNIETLKEGTVEYNGTVTNGNHTLTLFAEDKLGNKKNYSWTFTVTTKPVISSTAPIEYLADLTPTISATVKSINGTINPESIVLKLNGKVVEHNYDPSVGKITYTPSTALENESYYKVDLVSSDNTNLTSSSTWKFYINSYPDMPDSNISNCTMCHSLGSSSYLNGNFEQIHARKLSFGGSHSQNDCARCHNYISQSDGCAQCHGDVDFDYAPHGSTPQINYSAKNFDRTFPVRINSNREMWDCVICHQPGAGTRNSYNILLKNHDIPEVHKTSAENYTDCNKCHAKSLTREHSRDGRTDMAGNPITCKTCHENSDLKSIIQANKTDCISCHTNVDHKELHTNSSFDSSCMTSGCHTNVLSEEHSTRGLSCQGCHEVATNIDYKEDFKQGIVSAITWNQLACSECHTGTITHGVSLAKTIPKDLKYTPSLGSLDWMNPKSLSFWEEEAWVPEDMSNGLYSISKRSSSLSGVEVFNYYQGKMAELGWLKKSGPNVGSNHFELIYSKGTAKAIIRFYDGSHYHSEQSVGAGYRIEVLYK